MKISSPIIWYFLWFLEKLLIIIILYRSNQKYYDIIIYSKYNTSSTFYSTFSRQMTNTFSFIWRIVTYVTAALVSCVSCVNVAQLKNASNVVGFKKGIFWLLVFADFFLNSNFQNLILRTIPKVLLQKYNIKIGFYIPDPIITISKRQSRDTHFVTWP